MDKLKSKVSHIGQSNRDSKRPSERLPISRPVQAQFPSTNLVIGSGVAIFHVKSARVVLCYHARDEYYFLPKGRRDVNESTEQGAEREGYEESGYRNRLLPIVLTHRQPQPHVSDHPEATVLVTEPVWTMLMPQTAHSQYLLFWYISETLPPQVEAQLNTEATEAARSGKVAKLYGGAEPYIVPPKYPLEYSLKDRLAAEPPGYEPSKHDGTSADEEEMLYESELVAIDVAIDCLGGNSVMADVVRRGWAGILARMETEGIQQP